MLATMIYYIAFLDRPNEPHEKWSRLLLAANLQLTLCLSTNDSHYEVVISSDLCFYQIVNERPACRVVALSFRHTMMNCLVQNLAVLTSLLSSKRTWLLYASQQCFVVCSNKISTKCFVSPLEKIPIRML